MVQATPLRRTLASSP